MSDKKGGFLSNFSGTEEVKPLDATLNKSTSETITKPADDKKEKPDNKSKATDAKKAMPLKDDINKQKQIGAQGSSQKEKNSLLTPQSPDSSVIKAPQHKMTKDKDYDKKRNIRVGIIAGSGIVVAVLIFFLVRMLNAVTIPDFTGDQLSDAQIWGIQNNITIETEQAYSLVYDSDVIFDQSREPGGRINRGGLIRLTISQGPDMNEIIELPDFEEMNRAEITSWRNANRMNQITLRDEASADVGANEVIRVEVPGDVDVANFTRQDRLVIYLSTGPVTVTVPNLLGNSEEQLNTFIEQNPSINVIVEQEASETVAPGTVMRQSLAPNTRLAVGEDLTVTVSGGPSVVVPNFSVIPRADLEMEIPERLQVVQRERYHATTPFGRVISQSVAAGEEVFGENAVVIVTYSLGRPWIDDGRGSLMENQIQELIYNFNSRGAAITFNVVQVDSYLPRGTVVSMNRFGQFLAMNDHINFQVSRGNRTPPTPPVDFPGNGDFD